MNRRILLNGIGLIIAVGLIVLAVYAGNTKFAQNTLSTIKDEGIYNGIEYSTHIVKLQESLKLAGVSSHAYPDFENIQKYHESYKKAMQERCEPYVEIGFSGDATGGNAADWDYIFGCQVDSLDGLPEGLVGLDTGVMRFAVITFRADSAEELVGDAGGANAMQIMTQYIKESWLPEHLNEVNLVRQDSLVFDVEGCYMNLLEVYQKDIDIEPEMSLYIPMK